MRHGIVLVIIGLGLALNFCFFNPGPTSALAYWSTDPAANDSLCTAPGNQSFPRAIRSGWNPVDGFLVTWHDSRNGGFDIYAQRINESGGMLWPVNGEPVCTVQGDQVYPVLTSDGMGGAIIAWYDYRGEDSYFDVYAQRIDLYGGLLWDPSGVPLCRAPGTQSMPSIVSDGAGGAIVTWYDNRNSGVPDVGYIYAQRVDSHGNPKWQHDGVAVCDWSGGKSYPKIVSDGTGGAIVAFTHSLPDSSGDIYVQRVDSTGTLVWSPCGVPVCESWGTRCCESIVSDGAGGAIVAWREGSDCSGGCNIYAQHVLNTGQRDPRWPSCGRVICNTLGDQDLPAIAKDGVGGAIISWQDSGFSCDNHDIYAQRVGGAGNTLWADNGVPICRAEGRQTWSAVVADGAGDAVVCWKDERNGGYDIYAQRVDAAGNNLWVENGVPVTLAPGDQAGHFMERPQIVLHCTGSAVVVWSDSRSGDDEDDIYGQRINDDGAPGSGVGACCYGSYCEMITLDLCLLRQGSYRGSCTVCAPDYCETSGVEGDPQELGIRILSVTPNPFTQSTLIRYAPSEPGRIRLEIFDASGRSVRILEAEETGTGVHSLEWDGKGWQGTPVAPGVYLVRLTAGRHHQTCVVVRAK